MLNRRQYLSSSTAQRGRSGDGPVAPGERPLFPDPRADGGCGVAPSTAVKTFHSLVRSWFTKKWFSKVPPPAVLGEAEVHKGGELPDVVPLVPEVSEPPFCRVEEALYGHNGEILGHHHRLGQAGRSECGFEVLQVPRSTASFCSRDDAA